MKPLTIFATLFAALGTFAVFSQNPPPAAPRTGPGVQAPQDSKYADLIKTCKVPPAGRGGGAAKGGHGLQDWFPAAPLLLASGTHAPRGRFTGTTRNRRLPSMRYVSKSV